MIAIVLVQPEIPGNTGAVGRTCVALDMELILIHPLLFGAAFRLAPASAEVETLAAALGHGLSTGVDELTGAVERLASEARATRWRSRSPFARACADAGLPVMDTVSHIVPLMVGCPIKAKKISDILLAEYGVYVQPINYPTVPRGTERLRFTPGPAHDEAMMRELTAALIEIWDRLDLRVAA